MIGSLSGRLRGLNGTIGTITIVAKPSGYRRTVETDENGNFRCDNLPTGDYTITYLAKGYNPQAAGFWLNDNRVVEVDMELLPPDTVTISRENFNLIVGGLAAALKLLGEGK